jgi:hypothetical protein
LRSVRGQADQRLLGLPNVVGSMLGVKQTDGELTGEIGIVVFVSDKVPLSKLKRSQRIPASLNVEGKTLLTDVLPYTGMRLQATSAFPSGTLTTYDGTEYGTLCAFARSQSDVCYGLTCAHVIEGADNNAYSQSPIAIWSPALQRALFVGQSAMALAGGGAGVPGAFGFSDAALFTLAEPTLRDRALKGSQIPFGAPKFGERVFGSATSGAKTGTVVGIEKRVGTELADVIVKVDQPGTFKGDSGMLWRNANGHAVGIHAKGDGAPGVGSGLSAAMSAYRAATGLQVLLINP